MTDSVSLPAPVHPKRSNHPLSRSCITKENQFIAVLGDLKHKTDVYRHFATLGLIVDTYFRNSHQAWYILEHWSKLAPEPSQVNQRPSAHTLGTIFEHAYETDPFFALSYLRTLPPTLEPAPELPSDY